MQFIQRPSFEEQQRFILEKYSKKEDKIFLSPDELIKYLEEKKKDIQYIEEKEQLVNIYKSINLESLGEFRYKPGDDLDLLNKQIIGAIYLDGGFDKVKLWVEEHILIEKTF